MVISRRIMNISCMYHTHIISLPHISSMCLHMYAYDNTVSRHRITFSIHAYIIPYHTYITFSIMHISYIYHVYITTWYHVPYHNMIWYHILIQYHDVIRPAAVIRAQSVIPGQKIGRTKIAIYHAVSCSAYQCRGRRPYHAYITIYQHMVSRCMIYA